MRILSQAAPARGHRRSGTVLLQTLVVMGIASVLLGLVITCIHHLLRANSNVRQSVWDGTVQIRLASEFRRDCRLANSVSQQQDTCSLAFASGRTVEYTANGREVTRKWAEGDDSGSDNFRFAKGWSSTLLAKAGVVRLTLHRERTLRSQSGVANERTIVLESRVGATAGSREPDESAGGDKQ